MTSTCTIVAHADGTHCGAPAVSTFTGRDGVVYAECAEHAAPGFTPATPEFAAGVQVRVNHGGKVKVGTLVDVRRTRCTVAVLLADGRTKNIDRGLADVEPIA